MSERTSEGLREAIAAVFWNDEGNERENVTATARAITEYLEITEEDLVRATGLLIEARQRERVYAPSLGKCLDALSLVLEAGRE